MASTAVAPRQESRPGDPPAVRAYCWATVAVFIIALPLFSSIPLSGLEADGLILAGWIALVAVADSLRVRLWDDFSFAMSMPIVLAAVIVLVPWQAAAVAALGSLDSREIRARVPLARALFNRAEVGLAVMAAAGVFRALGGEESWPGMLLPAFAAGVTDLAVNTAIVAFPVAWLHQSSVADVIRRATGPASLQFTLIYGALWLLAPLTVLAYMQAGLLGVGLVVAPAALARTAFVQTIRASEFSSEVEVKRKALANATDQVAQERREERRLLAGELHDEVLPALFKVHLMGEVLRKDLEQGRLLDLESDVPELAAATTAAQAAIRRLMNELRESSLGRDGLYPTLELLARQLEASSVSRFLLELEGTASVSDLAQLVAYQVAREAMTNAARYSHADVIEVRLSLSESALRLVVADSGIGFDPDAIDRTEHLGLQLMRERVESLGGSLVVDSKIGAGTMVVAALPTETVV